MRSFHTEYFGFVPNCEFSVYASNESSRRWWWKLQRAMVASGNDCFDVRDLWKKNARLTGNWSKGVWPNVRPLSVVSVLSLRPFWNRTVSWPVCCRWVEREPAVGSWGSSACRLPRNRAGSVPVLPSGCRRARHRPPRNAPFRFPYNSCRSRGSQRSTVSRRRVPSPENRCTC